MQKQDTINPISSTVLVVESDIKNILEIQPIIEQYCVTYSNIERTLFNTLKDKNKEEISRLCNLLQKEYIEKYKIHARLFKSLWRQVNGKIQSIKSNNKNNKNDIKRKITELEAELLKDKYRKWKKEFWGKKKYRIQSKINKLNQKLRLEDEIHAVWGSKSFFRKQWNLENFKDKEDWKQQWEIRRNNNMTIIGSSDETFGNSLCQLQNLNKIRLTLPKCISENLESKYIDLVVDFNKEKKLYKYLHNAINKSQALTFRIYQNSKNKKFYVQIMFSLSEECKNLNLGTIGVDLNYNLIATCNIKKDGNKSKFKNYYFNSNDKNKNKNRQEISKIVNEIVKNAKENNKSITIEKINLKNVSKTKKISYVLSNIFSQLIRSRCIKNGVLLTEIDPKYTSIIGDWKYKKRFGISRHASASYVIGRRGMNYIEKIPSGYIYLLQGEEKDKSLLDVWKILNKKLQIVSGGNLLKKNFKKITELKSFYANLVYKDQTKSSFNLT